MIILSYITITLLFIYILQISWYGYKWIKLKAYAGFGSRRVDIIIPFRNEAKHLPYLIACLKEQDYPATFRVIFVNDHSEDLSRELVIKHAAGLEYTLIDLQEERGKKAAIKRAWQEVTASYIVHTDADTRFGKYWLRSVTAPLNKEHVLFVSGPVAFEENEGLFSYFVITEFAGLVAIGAAHIKLGLPMICNGANLAYKKELLEITELHEKYASGDDVFLMHSAHKNKSGSVVFQKHEEALVTTKGPDTIKSFMAQRIRWSSKNTAYGLMNTILLLVPWLLCLVFLVNLLSFSKIGITLAGVVLSFKVLYESVFFEKVLGFFKKKSNVLYQLFGQIYHIPYIVFTPLISKIVAYKWKGRKLH